MKTCFIYGSADITDYSVLQKPAEQDVVIAADGGIRHLIAQSIVPTVWVGDKDSLSQPIPQDVVQETHPVEKDETDTYLALQKGLQLGCERFYLFGCLGGAISHTIANIQLLADLAAKGIHALLLDETTEIMVLHNNSVSFDENRVGKLSVFALSEQAEGVSISGLYYPLTDTTLTNRFPLGVSNRFIGKTSTISVKNGDLLLILEK